ncbi:MAG: hypothetical protein OEV99_09245 [Nitrospira sp.]|nr:hypothetical protein [Nitrospira sp.]
MARNLSAGIIDPKSVQTIIQKRVAERIASKGTSGRAKAKDANVSVTLSIKIKF